MKDKMEKSGVKWSLLLLLVWVDQSLQESCQKRNSSCFFQQKNVDECEFNCPSFEVDSRIDVEIWSEEAARIRCNGDPSWSDFKLSSSGKVEEVNWVTFESCSLPEVSLHDITKRIGVQPKKKLKFESYKDLGSSLDRRHLSGFPKVDHLSLSSNNLRQVPDDLLNDFPELTVLMLRGNELELPDNFFRNLSKLRMLELGANKMTRMNPSLFSSLNRLELLNLWGNKFTDIEPRTFVGLTALRSLDLQKNRLTSLHPEVLKPLKKLTALSIGMNKFSSLPDDLFSENRKLTTLRLNYNRGALTTLPNRFLSNLPRLKKVHLEYNNLTYLPEDLLSNSSSIKILSLSHNSLSTLPQSLFKDLTNLKSLDLSWNKITSLPDRVFKSLRKLETLELQNNHIFEITWGLFSGLSNLESLNLESNGIRIIQRSSFGPLDSLKFARLSHNQITLNDEVFAERHSPFQNCLNLVELHLVNNSITRIFEDWTYVLLKISKIDLRYNLISEVYVEDFNFLSNHMTLDIRHNKIKTIDLLYAPALVVDFADMKLNAERDVVILADENPIVCDCRLNSFLNYLNGHMNPMVNKLFQIKSDNLKCSGPESMAGTRVSDLKYESFVCQISDVEEECDFFWREHDRTIIANCSNRNLREVPKSVNFTVGYNFELDLSRNFLTEVPSLNELECGNVTVLLLSHNNISTFTAKVMPPTLQVLELHGNDMKRINTTALEIVVNSTSLKRLTLHENPWICDCEANSLRKFIRNNERRLPDIWNTSCGDGTHKGMKFSTMANDDLCPCQAQTL